MCDITPAMDTAPAPTFTDPRARRIGRRIRERRTQLLEMTQVEFAEAFGLSQAAVSQWESGQRLPSLPSLMKLRGALGLSDEEWLDWVELAASPRAA